MNKSKKKLPKKKPPARSPNKKQKALLNMPKKNTKNIYAIFLVRQGLRSRSEQFITLADAKEVAITFCRTTLTPKYCKENLDSIRTGPDESKLPVTYDRNLLLIKNIDFSRKEFGRINSSPLWYWNVTEISVLTKETFK